MHVLIVESDPATRHMLEKTVAKEGYQTVIAADNVEAWEKLQTQSEPVVMICDWMSAGINGTNICRYIQKSLPSNLIYIIILTDKNHKEHTTKALKAGANDFIIRPFSQVELQARIKMGTRILDLQKNLAEQIQELENTRQHLKQLHRLLPICSFCKKIRNDKEYWQQVETYIGSHLEAVFNHCICPDCYQKFVEPELDEFTRHLEHGKLRKSTWRRIKSPESSVASTS